MADETWARVTMHLPGGLRPGDYVPVDMENPTSYVLDALEAGALVIDEDDEIADAQGDEVSGTLPIAGAPEEVTESEDGNDPLPA